MKSIRTVATCLACTIVCCLTDAPARANSKGGESFTPALIAKYYAPADDYVESVQVTRKATGLYLDEMNATERAKCESALRELKAKLETLQAASHGMAGFPAVKTIDQHALITYDAAISAKKWVDTLRRKERDEKVRAAYFYLYDQEKAMRHVMFVLNNIVSQSDIEQQLEIHRKDAKFLQAAFLMVASGVKYDLFEEVDLITQYGKNRDSIVGKHFDAVCDRIPEKTRFLQRMSRNNPEYLEIANDVAARAADDLKFLREQRDLFDHPRQGGVFRARRMYANATAIGAELAGLRQQLLAH